MPAPPIVNPFDQVGFVVQYFFNGCSPRGWLDVTLSKPPELDLIMLIVGLDPFDIAQTLIEPRGGRERRSGRHGRKRKPRFRFPDSSDMVGNKLRAIGNPYDGLRLSPVRWLFPIWNVAEFTGFTAAILEGFAEVGFQRLWGLIQLRPENCPQLAMLDWRLKDTEVMAGIVGSPFPFILDTIEADKNFFTGAGRVFSTDVGEYKATGSVRMKAISQNGAKGLGVAIVNAQTNEVLDASGTTNLDEGEAITLTASANVPAGEPVYFARIVESGSIRYWDAQVFAYAFDNE